MRNNNEKNIQSESAAGTTESRRGTSPRSTGRFGLKLVIAAVSVTAAWLSCQTVNEAIALHRLLDRMHTAMSEGLVVKAPASTGSNITETKARVAGL